MRRQRIVSLEEEVLKAKVSAEERCGEQFSDNGQICNWNKEKKEYLENIPFDQTADPHPKLLYHKV